MSSSSCQLGTIRPTVGALSVVPLRTIAEEPLSQTAAVTAPPSR
jgi:hypothetical protein